MQIEKLGGARITLETQILHLEQITITKEALTVMKAGAETMKEIQGHMYSAKFGLQVADVEFQEGRKCRGHYGRYPRTDGSSY